ncbi:MAG TPA: LytTR family DNA-binding domain-containing protein [Saprospiraceae bacterium]|nr:LytTR family DNA-binding domain-containing protein [Saprospiraceae bacterium]
MNTQPIPKRTSKVIPIASGQRLTIVKRNDEAVDRNLNGSQTVFPIATKGKIEMICFSEIIYVESESNYIRFHLVDKRLVFAAKTLKEVSNMLEGAGFIRVHKSFMLHPDRIKQYDIANNLLQLRSGEKIPVSRSNRKMVSEKLLTCSW